MAAVVPRIAPVRPRVRPSPDGDSRPLEEVLEESCEEYTSRVLWLVGDAGAGKSMALSHLAATFEGDPRFEFVDDFDFDSIKQVKTTDQLIVAGGPRHPPNRGTFLQLEPWGCDELAEYLLAVHPDRCSSVMRRLSGRSNEQWMPEVARVILDQFAGDAELNDPESAATAYIEQHLGSGKQRRLAQRLCLAHQRGRHEVLKLLSKDDFHSIPESVRRLLRHSLVQVPMAAELISEEVASSRSMQRTLEIHYPLELIERVAMKIRSKNRVRGRLKSVFSSPRMRNCQPTAASLLCRTDSSWKPFAKDTKAPCLVGGHFQGVNWESVELPWADLSRAEMEGAILAKANLSRALLTNTDLTRANLKACNLQDTVARGTVFFWANLVDANLMRAKLNGSRFDDADLTGALLRKADLGNSVLSGASLRRASLYGALLVGSVLEDADLSNAAFDEADCRGVDFRSTALAGAHANGAHLQGANFEDVKWPKSSLRSAKLSQALLTGSDFSSGDLSFADLPATGLAEINWEDVDLRQANLAGATFHMGSSRSGLVDSPYASEGTRTGFYTDDLEELYFKSPEEVRKANLRGADLRGANLANVDFYLVDLRGAKLDPKQRAQASQTGAILSDDQFRQ